MQRRTRNTICIWLIFGGLLNFLVYTVVYARLGGDAKNGGYGTFVNEDGHEETGYFIGGHFVHGRGGRFKAVPRWVWIYSYLHSISLFPTIAAFVVSMLILARPHIIATMREGTWIRGPTFIAVIMTLTVALCAAGTLWFTLQFISDLTRTVPTGA